MLDICMDVQRAEINPEDLHSFKPEEKAKLDSYEIREVVSLLSKAKRPEILLGAGSQGEKTKKLIDTFLSKTQIPAVCSLMGLGVVRADYPYYLGLLGSYGNRCANKSMETVDLLITIGSRLDTRQTGAKYQSFVEHGTIIQVDIDKNELNCHRLENRVKVNDSAEHFLEALLNEIDTVSDYSEWHKEIVRLKEKYNQEREVDRVVNNKGPYSLMKCLNTLSERDDVFVSDIGHNQMIAAQMLKLTGNQKYITSGGLAPMGFSLPISAGIAMANQNRRVISISGDGGFHMASQSLMLISQYNLPVIAVILNNQSLGMITQFQSLYFEGRMNATTQEGGYCTPDFMKMSEAYGLKYYRIDGAMLEDKELMSDIFSNKNCVVEFITDSGTK